MKIVYYKCCCDQITEEVMAIKSGDKDVYFYLDDSEYLVISKDVLRIIIADEK